MNEKEHVKQDEWSYSVTKTAARGKVKRARIKAKRAAARKNIKKILEEDI